MSKLNQHRGEILENVVKNSGIRAEVAAKKSGYSRSAYYKHIKERDLALHILIKYSNGLGYDFSSEIPELKKLLGEGIKREPSNYGEAVHVISEWKEKYYTLLEKYNTLLEQREKYAEEKKKQKK